MGGFMRFTVKKAARLAVYVEMRISEKNHHALVSTLPGNVAGVDSELPETKAPNMNQ